MITPEGVSAWLSVARKFALSIIGVVGLTILLIRYFTTGDVPLPILAAFAGLLGLNSISLGRGSTP